MLGIVIVAENVPEELAVTLDGVVVIVLVSNFRVILLLTVNPEPETVTELPAAPEVGLNVTVVTDEITLNVADAVAVLSVADTVRLPVDALVGTTKVTLLNAPDDDVVTVAGLVVTVAPSNLIVIVLLPPKPEPDTVTVLPTRPEVGDNVIVAPTVKVAVVVFIPSSAVTVWLPALVLADTVNVPLKLPELLDVIVVGLVVTVLPSNFIVMVLLAAKLVPETTTVTALPGEVLLGESVITASVVTVKAATAEFPA